MLLDSASLYFRAFHGVPDSVTAPDGTPVNAVRGFLDSIAFLVTTWADRLVACWDDDWRPAFRVEALPSYKAHRVAPDGGEDAPDLLLPQVDVIVDVLAALGIARSGPPVRGRRRHGHPGHPCTATSGDPVDVVTGDRDLFQLVDDAAGVRVLYCGKGVRKADAVTQTWLQASTASAPVRATPTWPSCAATPPTGCPA